MRILNLGCGTKTSSDPRVLNLDWGIYLIFRTRAYLRPFARLFITGERWTKFQALPDNIRVHDLRRGIPFEDSSVDAIYNSHFLEHIDRPIVAGFLREAWRALRPGGIHRIVVPDLEFAGRLYYQHLRACESNPEEIIKHDYYVYELLGRSVMREAPGTSRQSTRRRWLENMLLGDARKRGQTHQWMYDRFNLTNLLKECGYVDVEVCSYTRSSIPEWDRTGLDTNTDGLEYKPNSLYIEARKP